MTDVVIVDAVRTPIGALGGSLAFARPDDLAALLIAGIVERNQLDPTLLEEVYLGCANQAGEDNRDIARMALLLAGLPVAVAGVTVNRLCASGLSAINQAARAIRSGEGEVFLAGGVESMSRAPFSLPKAESGFAYGNVQAWDTALGWRYPNVRMRRLYGTESMGETAENIALERPDLTRERQDAFALRSHQGAIAAIDAGRFTDEIIPVPMGPRGGVVQTIRHEGAARSASKEAVSSIVRIDERPRRNTSLESLRRLKPIFREGGSVTAGNSSGLNDGAAVVLLMSAGRAKQLGYKPLARIMSSAVAGVAPRVMGYGPIPATRKALLRAGLDVHEIGLVELNEAFAVQSLAVIEDLELDPDIVNVNGGAIALGHPLGCSGARLLTTLVHEMRRREHVRYALATLCVGVGQGETTILESMH